MQVWNFYFTPYYIFVKLLQSSVKYGIIIKKLIVILYRLEQNMSDLITIIVPCYNEQETIPYFLDAMNKVYNSMKQKYDIDMEYLFVDDGSKDKTLEVLKECSKKDPNVSYLSFSRNFGKEGAVFAGITQAEGDCIAVMDCDLQHPPETLIKMYRLWEDGYQVIEGVKASRGRESFIHKMFAKTFYSIISDATGIDMSRASDFKLMDRQAAEEFLKLPERNVFFRALSSWVGFKTTYVEFDVQEREAGESKWSFKSLVRYAVNNITSFSAAPMQIVTFFGVVFFVFAVLLGIQSLYMYFSGHAVAGFTTVILLLLLVGSILMFSLGVIGYYIAKIYDEVKMRPRYIISEVIKSKE